MLRNTDQSYGSVAKFFHWTISALVILMLIVGSLMGYLPKPNRAPVVNIHKLVGLAILVLVVLRLSWKMLNVRPRLADMPKWMIKASYLSHYGLYVLLIAMPLSGWVMASAAGKPPQMFGWQIMLPIEVNKAVAHTAAEAHEVIAWILFGFVLVHIAAALYHHFIRRDNTLKRMLPGK